MGVCSFCLPWFHSDWGLVGGWGVVGGGADMGKKPYDLLVSVLKKVIKRCEKDRSGCPEGREGERKGLQRQTQKDMLNKCLKRGVPEMQKQR